MVKVITPDLIDEPVKRFLSGADVSSEVSMIEVNGRLVYLMARPVGDPAVRDEAWTMDRNQRRHDLIDKQIEETITLEEAVELAHLQSAFARWLDAKAPLPLDHVRKLHDQLVEQALAKSRPE